MKLDDITLDVLLANKQIRSAFIDPQWYFSYEDMNDVFAGAFQNINKTEFQADEDDGLVLECISFSNIFLRLQMMKPMSEFERMINIGINHTPKD